MNIQELKSIISKEPRKLFLIDGYGALLSAFLYLVILRSFERFFGMPSRVLIFLGVLALGYAAYSMTCYWRKPKNWRPFLKIIAIANLLHCCLTIGLVMEHFPNITVWGLFYFSGEVIVVVALAIYELRTASA